MEEGREGVVAPDCEYRVEELSLVEMEGEDAPGLAADRTLKDQFVDGSKKGLLQGIKKWGIGISSIVARVQSCK